MGKRLNLHSDEKRLIFIHHIWMLYQQKICGHIPQKHVKDLQRRLLETDINFKSVNVKYQKHLKALLTAKLPDIPKHIRFIETSNIRMYSANSIFQRSDVIFKNLKGIENILKLNFQNWVKAEIEEYENKAPDFFEKKKRHESAKITTDAGPPVAKRVKKTPQNENESKKKITEGEHLLPKSSADSSVTKTVLPVLPEPTTHSIISSTQSCGVEIPVYLNYQPHHTDTEQAVILHPEPPNVYENPQPSTSQETTYYIDHPSTSQQILYFNSQPGTSKAFYENFLAGNEEDTILMFNTNEEDNNVDNNYLYVEGREIISNTEQTNIIENDVLLTSTLMLDENDIETLPFYAILPENDMEVETE